MKLRELRWRNRLIALGILLVAGLLVSLGASLFVAAGGVDVAADRPHGWLTYQLLHFAFRRSVGTRAGPILPPADLDAPSRVKLGAQHFQMVCSNCHGAPGLGQSPVALSMTPRPQYLPAVLDQFSDAELFWIVKHGVKFSAMPSWTTRERDDEVWSMVAFLRQLPGMSAQTYLDLAVVLGPEAAAPPIAFGAAPPLREADTRRNAYPSEEHRYAVPAAPFGDKTVLADALAVCSRCHGEGGTGSATEGEAPNLTIQSSEYLEASLRAFAGGTRHSGYMQPVAAELSPAQIAALTAHYAGLSPHASGAPADSALAERGRAIATEGLREHGVPGCAACHQGAGAKMLGAPNLDGQSALYLSRQLAAMRGENRGSTRFWNPMPAVAALLSNEDIAAVAAYYAGREPAGKEGAATAGTAPAAPGSEAAAGTKMFGEVCAKCHTPEALGDKQGDFPNLTIQTADYAMLALHAYRSGERKNEKMQLVTSRLGDADIAALAAYLGGLAPKPAAGAPPDAEAAARGEAIATRGSPAHNVPACLSCHDQTGTLAVPLIPRLNGQNADYLRNKLAYFAGPLAAETNALNPMPKIAGALTERERSDLADYFAAQAPLEKAALRNGATPAPPTTTP